MPYIICAPPRVLRNPVTTSSKISSASCFLVRSRSPCSYSVVSGTWPKEEPVGSRMIPQMSGLAANAAVAAARSPGATRIDFSATPASTPGVGEPSKWLE